MIQAFIFDLDGTLIDSEKDLMLSANVCMLQFGFPGHTEETIKSFMPTPSLTLEFWLFCRKTKIDLWRY